MPPLALMLKPASGLCNMRCAYCFYADETAHREIPTHGMMTAHTLEAILQRVLAFAEGSCSLLFQGGEPTLAGLDFFETVAALEQKYNIHKVKIHHALQTNGLTIDRKWAAFFAKHGYLVGLSLDGTKPLHDQYRLDAHGSGTFLRVTRSMQLLQQYRVDFNVLTVVTAQSSKHAGSIYSFLRKNKVDWQQYIPCINPLEDAPPSYALTPPQLERFLRELFDLWYLELSSGYLRSIRYFTGLIRILQGLDPLACEMNGYCSRQFAVESDGSVYPCDFYMLDEWRLGNLATDTFDAIEARRSALGFMDVKPHPDCISCKWGQLCGGGCRRDRILLPDGSLGKNRFCDAYAGFLEYAYPRLVQCAKKIPRTP